MLKWASAIGARKKGVGGEESMDNWRTCLPQYGVGHGLVESACLLNFSQVGMPEFFIIWNGLELRKPYDEGIGGPLGLDGCSLQRPKMVSRSYLMGNQVEKSSHESMNQIPILSLIWNFQVKGILGSPIDKRYATFTYPLTAILTDFAKTNSGEVAYLSAIVSISLPVLKKMVRFLSLGSLFSGGSLTLY